MLVPASTRIWWDIFKSKRCFVPLTLWRVFQGHFYTTLSYLLKVAEVFFRSKAAHVRYEVIRSYFKA